MSEQRRALITGITGQDGSYLSDYLLGLGYHVAGMAHSEDPAAGLPESVELLRGDLRDSESLADVIRRANVHEVYNLAGLTFVGDSYKHAELTCDVNAMGVLRL